MLEYNIFNLQYIRYMLSDRVVNQNMTGPKFDSANMLALSLKSLPID